MPLIAAVPDLCRPTRRPGARRQAGMSMVELLVGVAIGLIVVAGAAMLTAAQLGSNRNMLVEMQLQQDMRATLEIITRELRRAGSVAQPVNFVWTESLPGTDAGVVDDMASTSGADAEVTFRYVRGPQGQLGFRLNGSRLQTRLVATPGQWQDLTDNSAMEVMNFTITPRHAVEPSQTGASPQKLPCPRLCTGLTTDCWPTLRIREFTIDLTGRSRLDPAIQRTLSTVVRVRNDEIVLGGATVCPA